MKKLRLAKPSYGEYLALEALTGKWCERRESNPHLQLGRLAYWPLYDSRKTPVIIANYP